METAARRHAGLSVAQQNQTLQIPRGFYDTTATEKAAAAKGVTTLSPIQQIKKEAITASFLISLYGKRNYPFRPLWQLSDKNVGLALIQGNARFYIAMPIPFEF